MNNRTPAGKVIMNHLVSRNLSIKDLSELLPDDFDEWADDETDED